MNIKSFLEFNKICPVCEKPLQFYLSATDGPLWKATFEKHSISFDQLYCKDLSLENEQIVLQEKNNDYEIYFSHYNLKQKYKVLQCFLIALCNEKAIKEDYNKKDYSIDPVDCCYYRSSFFIEDNERKDFIKDEVFTFLQQVENSLEKVYILNMNYESNKTALHHYSSTAEERKNNDDSNIQIYSKDLPLLTPRPNFGLSKRGELISRFDTFILMS